METAKTKLLIVAHEMAPFLEITKISEITRKLPQAMQERGFEIRILMPKFGNINERRNRLHEVIRLSGMNIVIDDNDNPLIIKVASIPSARMQVYFLDNDEYFSRKHVFKDGKGAFFADNEERTIFFCKGALETVKKLGWTPDVVHCHGWMTALIPAYIKTQYKKDPTFKNAKVVYSAYQNCFDESLDASFSKKAIMADMTAEDMTPYGTGFCTDMHKGAIKYSDAVVIGDEFVTADVLKFVKTEKKQTLNFNFADNYNHFFDFYQEIARIKKEDLVTIA